MGCPADQTLFPSRLPPGPRNAITDVAGVTVGHCTLARGDLQTGVTAVLPHGGNLFREKIPAGCAVFNGFGKTMGLMQLAELGTLETPIVLTNTLSAGTAYTALVRRALEESPSIGVTTGTVNPLVSTSGASPSPRTTSFRPWPPPPPPLPRGPWGRAGGWSATAARAASAPPPGGRSSPAKLSP